MKAMKHWKNALLALAVVGTLSFGAVQAAGGTNPDTGCATKAGWATGCNNATRTARTTSSPTARCTTTPRR